MKTKVFPLSEGHFTVGRDKAFIPFDMDKDVLTDRSTGSLLVEVQPFLLVNEKDVIVFDTGLGFNNSDGEPQLIANLRAHNIEPEDVTRILLSHLHKDHAGGIPLILEDGRFDNATIYVYTQELEFAYEKGAPSYMVEEIDGLRHRSNMVFLDEEAGVIDGYIHYQHTGGHSPSHIVYWVETSDGKVFFGGDEAPQHKQMVMKYVAKYDFDGKLAMTLRAEWAKQSVEEGGWQFLFYHDVVKPIVKI